MHLLFFYRRLYHRPTDAELEEFHPKATRTLFVGGLSRDVTSSVVQEKFERFGEILEIDIKKSPAALALAAANIDPAKKSCYANVQFTDLSSVCKAIKECDGDTLAGNKITLGFARAVPTKCVWCSGVADVVKEKDIAHEFGRYGKIQDILILRSRGQALVWFDQVRPACFLDFLGSEELLVIFSDNQSSASDDRNARTLPER